MKRLSWTRTWLLCSLIVGASVLSQVGFETRTTAWAADGDNLGSFSGQVVLDGAIPKLDFATTDKDPKAAPELKQCGITQVPNEKLVVDPKTKGIANVAVYLQKAPAGMPAEYKKSKKPTVDFDQKGTQFLPHMLVVRTDQTVKVLSDDPMGHNTHTNPIRSSPFNSAIKAKERVGVPVTIKTPERLPVNVKCDIHPWMTAWWVVVDHPYVAITDAEGKFKIENLPPGEHKFTVWQESFGYLSERPGERDVTVTIVAKKDVAKTIKADVKKFK